MDFTKPHHVKVGMAGYGPDLDEYDEPYTGIREILDAISYELNESSDRAEEFAHIAAEGHDYEAAWKSHLLAEELDVMRHNLNYDSRLGAPLFVDQPDLLVESMAHIIDTEFPLGVDTHYARLYVWEATEETS